MLTTKNFFVLIVSLSLTICSCYSQRNITFYGELEKNVFEEVVLNRWQDTLAFMLSVDSGINYKKKEDIKIELDDFATSFLNKKKYNRRIIQKLSKKVGDEYLKEYAKFSNFYETVSKGKYDCLTSTILYAYLFEKLNLDYSIRETNYHIFLIVHLENQDLLIEPTDPSYGVVWGEKRIDNRLNTYREANEKKVDTFLADYRIDREVNFKQLLALQYYNKAVDEFNNENFKAALNTIKKSILVYDCDRNRGFITYSSRFAVSNQVLK